MKYSLLILFTFFSCSLFAQDILISSASGNVNILSGNTSVAARKGFKISATSTLQVKDNSTAMVVDTKGRSVYLKTAGNYTYKSLQQMLAKGKEDDLVKGYVDMLLKNMFTHGETGQTSVTTAVHRGMDLMMKPDDYAIVLNYDPTLYWLGPSSRSWMKVTVSDSTDVILDSVFKPFGSALRQYKVPLDKFKPGHAYFWKAELSPVKDTSDRYFHFLVADNADSSAILKDIKVMQANPNYKSMKHELLQYLYTKWDMYYRKKK